MTVTWRQGGSSRYASSGDDNVGSNVKGAARYSAQRVRVLGTAVVAAALVNVVDCPYPMSTCREAQPVNTDSGGIERAARGKWS